MEQQSQAPILTGLRVVELGRRMAAPIVGMVLAEQGAEVIRVVQHGAPAEDPLLDAVLARGKTEVALDPSTAQGHEQLLSLVSAADVVVENLGHAWLAEHGIDFEALRASTSPGLVSVSLPSFPEGDPRNALPDYEPIVGTAGYLYAKPIGVPQVHDFPLGSALAALFAATGTVGALIARARTGQGQHVSASLFDADIFAQVVLVLMNTGIPRGFLPLKMVGTPFMGSWKCGDGRYIYMHMSLPAHAALILDILEDHGHGQDVAELRRIMSEETLRDPSQVKSIPEAKAIKEVYERIFLQRPAAEWEEILGEQLCCIKVRTIEEWLPDTLDAGMADAARIDDPVFGELLTPGAMVSIEGHDPVLEARERTGDAQAIAARWAQAPDLHGVPEGRELEPDLRHPLQGMRVLDISRVIAGPCSARVLGELGAEVLSVQSPSRLDWALSFHLLFNSGKKSCTLDFKNEAGKEVLWKVIEDFKPHAFIQNYRHMELARTIGVGPEHLRERFPSIAYSHLNAYGNLGVWRDRPGFEQVVQAVSGIQMTYGKHGVPKLLPSPVIDIGTGLLGAFGTALALYQQIRTGESVVSTTHLTRTAVLFQALPIADSQRRQALEEARRRGEAVDYDPDRRVVGGILRARDGLFCVAGPKKHVRTWLSEAGLLHGDAPAEDNPLEHVSRRVWARSQGHWVESIAQAGLADTVVTMPVPSMRRMLEEVPQPVDGSIPRLRRRDFSGIDSQLTFIANPIQLSRTPMADVTPAPMRGEHSAEVLARVGEQAAEDAVIPYPEAKSLVVWLATLGRWGYFAWRSGNI